MFGSKDLLFSSEQYGVAKSLRFRSGSTTYLNRTPASAGNRTTWTWSGWVKRGALGTAQYPFYAVSGTTECGISFNSSNALYFIVYNAGATAGQITTTAIFRDPSAWYHVVAVLDSSNATSADRMRLYVNGVRQSDNGTAITLGSGVTGQINNTVPHYTGTYNSSLYFFDGYLAEVNFIDGQALTPSSFGFYDNNGIWQPKGYTGTYGTNGFYLKFTDVGATSGSNTGYGKDFSGFNTNYWTTNNFGTTSTATTYDSMLDSPTNATGDIGNYCVLNPLDPTVLTLSSGNLDATYAPNSDAYCTSTFRVSSGKWYWEYNITSVGGTYAIVGISSAAAASGALGSTASTYAYISSTGNKYNNGSATAYGNTYTSGAVVAVALDMDNGKLYFGLVSGGTITWQNTGDPVAGTNAAFTSLSGLFTPAINGRSSSNVSLNAGQRPFSASTLPSGFSALNTQNLTTPTITNGAAYMAAVTYTGSASTQNVTATSTNSGNNPNAVTFQPDLVWIKDRSNAQDHKWTDVVRGATKALESNTTDDEATDSNGVTAFNNNGFSLGTGTRAYSDSNGDSYIAWEWKENVSSGFDIVTYTGNGSARTISHSLNAVPNMIVVKARTTASTDQGWPVYHSANTSAPETDYLMLNTTAATADLDTVWNDTAPTSAVFSVGTNANVNANNDTYVAYLWAAIAGYSAFGSYAGNSSADGPFVYTGFRPRWIMIKITTLGGSAGYDWYIFDTSRDTYNAADLKIVANSSVIENQNSGGSSMAGFPIDILSNGFKIRNSGGNWNASSNTYIYAAFAENPFKISRAR